uniref:Uncharacterized protein n=1 Tax=Anguilla anguilla TaxID=7936 RepID=A0A0E9TBC5_ANGAN
MKSQLCSCH